MSAKDKFFYKKSTLRIRGNLIDLTSPHVMGIINITPDSFYGNSRKNDLEAILKEVETMYSEGATMVDFGAYSSRPGAADITEEEEKTRITLFLKEIRHAFPSLIISIDTFRPGVAKASLDLGADMINDISGGGASGEMLEIVARYQAPYVMMHMQGSPQTMADHTSYEDLLNDLLDYFEQRLNKLHDLGHNDVIIDPGFGFSKTLEQNYELLKNLNYFEVLERPVLVGISRKSMFYRLFDTTPDHALNATTAAHMLALKGGASILRVHDVKEAVEAIKIYELAG